MWVCLVTLNCQCRTEYGMVGKVELEREDLDQFNSGATPRSHEAFGRCGRSDSRKKRSNSWYFADQWIDNARARCSARVQYNSPQIQMLCPESVTSNSHSSPAASPVPFSCARMISPGLGPSVKVSLTCMM